MHVHFGPHERYTYVLLEHVATCTYEHVCCCYDVDCYYNFGSRLKYTDLKSVARDQELQKIQVRHHGFQGRHFRNMLPFSWIIKQHLDKLVHHSQSSNDGNVLDALC